MQATGHERFAAYFAYLTTQGSAELEHFINALTVNETYFYREEYQLRCLTTDLLRRRVAGKPPARLCASGRCPAPAARSLIP